MVARSRSPTGRQQSPLPSSWGGLRAGALVWFVPFAVACCFVNPEDGTKTIGPDWFRVLMLTLGSLAGTYATHRCNPQTRRAGLTLALQILVVNYLLDLLVLVPLMIKEATDEEQFSIEAYLSTVPHWFRTIGGSYTAFVSMCVVAGDSAERATQQAAAAMSQDKSKPQ